MFIKINGDILENANLIVNDGQAELTFYSDTMTLNEVEQQFLNQDLELEYYNDENVLISKYYTNSLFSIRYERERYSGRWQFVIDMHVSTIDVETFDTLTQQINNIDGALAELGEIVSYYEDIISNMQQNYDNQTTVITELTQRIAALENNQG